MKISDSHDQSFLMKCWVVLKLGLPSIAAVAIFEIQVLINIYYVSHLGDKSYISAVGLGNMILNSMILSSLQGINSNIETLVSQAYGTGNLEICGIYLNRAIVMMTCTFLVTIIIIFKSEDILIMLYQPKNIAAHT